MEESFLAVIIMGIVFVQNVTMLEVWQPVLKSLENLVGTDSYFVTFTITFLIAMALPISALAFTALVSGKLTKDKLWSSFAKFGYAIIPLDLAGHVAHNLFHLLAEGGSVWFTFLGLFGIEVHDASPALVSSETIQILQYLLVVLGTLASIYTAYKIAKNNYGEQGATLKAFMPYLVLMVVLGLVNAYLFYLPMAMRM